MAFNLDSLSLLVATRYVFVLKRIITPFSCFLHFKNYPKAVIVNFYLFGKSTSLYRRTGFLLKKCFSFKFAFRNKILKDFHSIASERMRDPIKNWNTFSQCDKNAAHNVLCHWYYYKCKCGAYNLFTRQVHHMQKQPSMLRMHIHSFRW